MSKPYMVLNVYSPETHHGEAVIVGDRDALVTLRSAINEALGDGRGKADVYANDGEGYEVRVLLVGERRGITHDEFNDWPVHYVHEDAREKDDAKWSVLAALVVK